MVQRNQFIDSLRGSAILVMILTHTTSFFPSDNVAESIWNWSHFSVSIFIFCSAYLFFQKNLHASINGFAYLKKRIMRLVIPYYLFLIVFLPLMFLIKPETVTIKYILQSIFIIGGVDINWLVLLFLYFALIMPFFVILFQKYKIFFWAFFGVVVTSSVLFLFYSSPIPYKYLMWIPWSLVLYFTLFFMHYEKKSKKLLLLLSLTLAIFGLTYYTRTLLNQSTILIHNKYPPNILYLSYGLSVILGLSFFMKRFEYKNRVVSVLHYFSRFSYPLYFIHYVILTILAVFLPHPAFNWFTFFAVVLLTTVVVQKCLYYIVHKLKKSHLVKA